MKKNTLLLLLCSYLSFGQSFYDENTIQDIRIVFAQSNWDAILDAAEASDAYTQATSITINGTILTNVGVKFKGNSSYNASYNKNPFHIELDTYQDQDYQGYTDIKLNNVIFDPTFVRETVAYNITRKYMHAPLSNYANLYVNGTLIGLYTNVESISKKFVDNHFGSKTNAFFNCSPPAGAGPTTTNLPNLAYLGTSSTSYESAYEMKSDLGWDDLITLTNTLSNDITNIETILDVDRAIWMLALDNVMVNLDSYIGQFKQNYYIYKDDNGRFSPIKWDFNMCFGTFGMTGSGAPLNNTTSKRQLSHTLHSTESSWPLVQKILAIPSYKKKYLAHYKTILTENFSNNSYYATAQAFQTLISASVTADPNKFYTNAQFTSNMTTDVNLGMNTAPGLSNLMPGRVTYLSALSDFTATQPTIANITPSNTLPTIGDVININATVTNVTGSSVYLGYRTDALLPFNKITLYDDGAHNDGAAGDNVYGNAITITSITTQYYIYGENTTIGKFSPERAEHEYYSLTATYPKILPGEIVVNELMAQNTSTVTDPHGDYSDWFELYNNTSSTISLDYLYATDDPTNLLKWQFPSGLTIAPNSYLIVWADQDLNQEGIHADFKFSAAGESCVLSYSDGTIVDTVTFGAQTANMGYARIPNGTGSFVIQAPTFNANNESLSISSEVFNQSLTTYPNPTSGNLTIENSQFNIEKVEVYNLQGQLLYTNKYENTNLLNLDFSSYSNGMYLVVINSNTNIKIIKN
ncbi:CotH kinase family protein [Flavobacterium sp.]|uniref:CotH kinase family protein n=1 Tax=Flavobacterium sp. TaxID=239 RepID=UPI003D275BFD